MNQIQTKYARERAQKIYDQKIKSIKQKFTSPKIQFGPEELLAAFKDNSSVTGEELKNKYNYSDVRNFVIFVGESEEEINHEMISKETEVVKVAFDTLMDELVLGDNEQALALLKAFEAFE